MTITAEACRNLYDALEAGLRDRMAVFDVRPDTIVTPCVFLDVPAKRAAFDDGAPVTIVTIPVVAVFDGLDSAQQHAMRDVGDVIWDVARRLSGEPVSSIPDLIDVGGPRLRQLVTAVDVTVEHPTLCEEQP